MDSNRFDALTRTLSSRRTALGGLVGGVAGLLGLVLPEAAEAHNFLARCAKLKTPKRRAACRRRAHAHNRTHRRPRCVPQSPAITCAGRCGTVLNNCGQATPCTCSLTQTCLGNGSCAQVCAGICGGGCTCAGFTLEGGPHCIPSGLSCDQTPQTCSSTLECPARTSCQPASSCGGSNRCVPLCAS